MYAGFFLAPTKVNSSSISNAAASPRRLARLGAGRGRHCRGWRPTGGPRPIAYRCDASCCLRGRASRRLPDLVVVAERVGLGRALAAARLGLSYLATGAVEA